VTIAHHLDDATLISFAAGTLAEAHAIVIGAHLALCPHCRASLHMAEAIGGGVLADQTPVAVSQTLREATLASLSGLPAVAPKPSRAALNSTELPDVLVRALGVTSLDQIKWHRKLPGVAIYDVPLHKGSKAKLKLLALEKGRAMPDHAQGGEELTLVLKGSYSDKFGKFSRGDLADLAEDVEHQPIVDSDETCICLISFDVPARFKSIWARLAQPFSGL
jgi:putative transcriptional regulator